MLEKLVRIYSLSSKFSKFEKKWLLKNLAPLHYSAYSSSSVSIYTHATLQFLIQKPINKQKVLKNVTFTLLLFPISNLHNNHQNFTPNPIKKAKKPSTRSTNNPHNWQPPPPKTPSPPYLRNLVPKIRRHRFPLVRFAPSCRHLFGFFSRGMFHQKRRRFSKPTTLLNRKTHLLQLHHLRLSFLRGPLA